MVHLRLHQVCYTATRAEAETFARQLVTQIETVGQANAWVRDLCYPTAKGEARLPDGVTITEQIRGRLVEDIVGYWAKDKEQITMRCAIETAISEYTEECERMGIGTTDGPTAWKHMLRYFLSHVAEELHLEV